MQEHFFFLSGNRIWISGLLFLIILVIPFYIKGTMPLTLMGKQTFSIPSGGLGSAVVHENDNVLRLFYYDASGGDGYAFYSRDTQNRGVLTYGGNNRACVITLYTFGYQYQNPPKFGIGILIMPLRVVASFIISLKSSVMFRISEQKGMRMLATKFR